VRATGAGADLHFACEQESDRGDREHGADHGKRIAETHDERLSFDDIAECRDGLMVRGSGIGYPV